MQREYVCPKCGSTEYIKGEIRTVGGGISKLLDVQNKRFIHISCKNCGYTEFYKKGSGIIGNVFDFLT